MFLFLSSYQKTKSILFLCLDSMKNIQSCRNVSYSFPGQIYSRSPQEWGSYDLLSAKVNQRICLWPCFTHKKRGRSESDLSRSYSLLWEEEFQFLSSSLGDWNSGFYGLLEGELEEEKWWWGKVRKILLQRPSKSASGQSSQHVKVPYFGVFCSEPGHTMMYQVLQQVTLIGLKRMILVDAMGETWGSGLLI